MSLTVLTEHARIRAELERVIATDPICHTILGTIALTLTDSAWAAVTSEGLAVRSSQEYPVVVAGDWADAAHGELATLLRKLPGLRRLSGPESLVGPLVADVAGGRAVASIGQRLFRCDELISPADVSGVARVAADGDRAAVRRWFAAFLTEVNDEVSDVDALADRALADGSVFVWRDAGATVSMAARRPVVAGSARIGPVYTPPAQRGHGYASGVTAAATRSILDEAAIPVLFTDLANPTSNKIYQSLGYYPVEDRVVVEFG